MKKCITGKKQLLIVLNIIVSLFLFTGCITYRNFPKEYIDRTPEKTAGNSHQKVCYRIENGSVFGGYERLDEIFRKKAPFGEAIKEDEIQKKGLFINIKIEQVIPSAASLIFEYFSISTLTILPVWSTKDGYNIHYDIYLDGNRLKRFTYEVRRRAFIWIIMLPFSWVNLFTYSESDAFQATANKFFIDAKEHL